MSRLPRLRGERGYTLVEMLTVLVIMSVVMTSLTTVFVHASNSETDMNNHFQA
jgi:prepilin-type N-terminal cleavage/methylation domain-containing protein